jgi:hypothetical protein
MGSGISHTLAGGVGTITMDDGKVNALLPHMLGELNAVPCVTRGGTPGRDYGL